jgi:hypothetical protein
MDSNVLILFAERLNAIKRAAKAVAASAAVGVGLLAALVFVSAYLGHHQSGSDQQPRLAKSEFTSH